MSYPIHPSAGGHDEWSWSDVTCGDLIEQGTLTTEQIDMVRPGWASEDTLSEDNLSYLGVI